MVKSIYILSIIVYICSSPPEVRSYSGFLRGEAFEVEA